MNVETHAPNRRNPSPLVKAAHWPVAARLAALALLASGGLWLAPPVGCCQEGQPYSLEDPLAIDLVVQITNGTTREPGRAESISVLTLPPGRPPVAELFNATGQATFQSIELYRNTTYIIQVMSEGVPYFAKNVGWELRREPQLTIYVFDTATELTGLQIEGLNLIVRRAETELQLEYMLNVTNTATPQKSVVPRPTTLQFAFPERVMGLQAERLTGPAPAPVDLQPGGETGRTGLVIPFPPGTTRLRLTASLPFRDEAELPVGANIPIQQWSALAFPSDMEVRGADMQREASQAGEEFRRYRGPALQADASLLLTISGGSGPVVADLPTHAAFDTSAAGDQTDAEDAGSGLASSWYIWIVIVLLAMILLNRFRRRS